MFEKKLSRKIQGKSYLRLYIATNIKWNSSRKPASKCPRKTRWQGIPEVDSLSKDVSFWHTLPKLETCFCNGLHMLLMLNTKCMLDCMLCTVGDVIGLQLLRRTCLPDSMPCTHLLQAHHITFFLPPTQIPHHTLNSPLPWRRAIALVRISWQ